MLAILFQEKTKKMLVFPKNAEKNASTIEKGLAASRHILEKTKSVRKKGIRGSTQAALKESIPRHA